MIAELYAQLRSLLLDIAAVYVFVFVAGVLVLVLAILLIAEFLKYRGSHLVMCPLTHSPALVRIDVPHAVMGRLLGERDLRLRSCSHWGAPLGCARECLKNWR